VAYQIDHRFAPSTRPPRTARRVEDHERCASREGYQGACHRRSRRFGGCASHGRAEAEERGNGGTQRWQREGSGRWPPRAVLSPKAQPACSAVAEATSPCLRVIIF